MSMKQKIKKAVIPAAGLGTRFLPATKSIPKEMLTIVDKPILFYVVEEAVKAGIQDIVLIQGRGKGAIEDFFDTSVELELVLERNQKHDLLDSIRRVKEMANIISVRQKTPMGLGHAVYMAKPVIGDEPFALLLGDEIMIDVPDNPSAIAQLTQLYDEYQKSTVAIMQVPRSDVSKYGIISGKERSSGLYDIFDLIEKPEPEFAPSQWAMPGRYVFSSSIFKYLENASPGKNGEIQLTDSMAHLAKNEGLMGYQVKARRYDAGDKVGYLKANIELALDRDDLRADLIPYLKGLTDCLSRSE